MHEKFTWRKNTHPLCYIGTLWRR